jgi:F-type H+-transporting ATPase subunit c
MYMKNVMMILFFLAFALPTFAADGTAVGEKGLLVPAFAMALAAGLCGLGQGRAIASAAEGVARNPGAAGKIQTLLLIGLVFIETLVLFTFVKVG